MRKSWLSLLFCFLMTAAIWSAPVYAQDEHGMEPASFSASASAEETPLAAEAAGEHHEESIGFPQLKTHSYATQVFWLFVFFVLLYALMSKLALPRVGDVIQIRKAQQQGNLDEAQRMQEEAQKLQALFEADLLKAQQAAQEKMTTAANTISEKLAAENVKFAEQSRKRVATAEQTILRAKLDAQQSILDVSAEIAADIVNKIAGTQLTKAETKRAVTTAAAQEKR